MATTSASVDLKKLFKPIAELFYQGYGASYIATKIGETRGKVNKVLKEPNFEKFMVAFSKEKIIDNENQALELAQKLDNTKEGFNKYLNENFYKFIELNNEIQKSAMLSTRLYNDMTNTMINRGDASDDFVGARTANLWLQNSVLATNTYYENFKRLDGILAGVEKETNQGIRRLDDSDDNLDRTQQIIEDLENEYVSFAFDL